MSRAVQEQGQRFSREAPVAALETVDVHEAVAAIQRRVRAEALAAPAASPRARRPRPHVLAWLLAAVLAAAGAVALVAALGTSGDSPEPTPAPAASPAAAAPAPRVADLSAPAAKLAAAARPGTVIGRVVIPSLAYERGLVQGADPRILRRDAGHYLSSPLPGQDGTVLVAARQVRHGFGALAHAAAGAAIELRMPYGAVSYRIEDVGRTAASDTSALHARSAQQRLVLTAVHRGERLVINASRTP